MAKKQGEKNYCPKNHPLKNYFLTKLLTRCIFVVMSAENTQNPLEEGWYETPRILTPAELMLLEILKSQLKIEEATLEAVRLLGEYPMNCYIKARKAEIERQIDELTRPVRMKYNQAF